ncbi:MAG: beta-carotene 15,15'-dioxygenase, Brp/Blh family [Bacteroidota bacterium]|nr:beta-carotene 15,15'-dioxygenase, Brp/Blh family [Bacteroidota bacterium]
MFAGLGAANSMLLLKMYENNLLTNKKIVIFEPNLKKIIHKTFCFWATSEEISILTLNELISNKWAFVSFNDNNSQPISPFNYYHINGSAIYNKITTCLNELDVIIYDELVDSMIISKQNYFEITLQHETILVKKIFDSRPPSFLIPKTNQSYLVQSFVGWKIKNLNNDFDVSSARLMDFNVPQNGFCQFIYILPFSESEALFEITRFGKEKIQKQEAEQILKDYIRKHNYDYEVIDLEEGCIPMTSSNIAIKKLEENWINTGINGGMLKASTGYAFHTMVLDAFHLSNSMIKDIPYTRISRSGRFKFYDRLLLKILEEKPYKGKEIFQSLFNNVTIKDILEFLNEQSNISKEILIFSKLPIYLFLKAAFNDILFTLSNISKSLLTFLLSLIAIILYIHGFQNIIWVILVIGFITVGLSHGAVDHLIDKNLRNKYDFFKFIIQYLFKSLLLGIVWIIKPDIALICFLLFSSWHFGQTDFYEWKLRQNVYTLFWGITLLCIILIFNFTETISILKHIPRLSLINKLEFLSQIQVHDLQFFVLFVAMTLIIITKSWKMLFTTLYLLLLSRLPLLLSFGFYFTFQHSLHGWKHLKSTLKMSSYEIWIKSLPFSIAGALLLAAFMYEFKNDPWGIFFILLSCMSLPHILSMDQLYKRIKMPFTK